MTSSLTSIPLWLSLWLMSLCEKIHMQLPLAGLEAESAGNQSPSKNNELPGGTVSSEARLKKRAKKKRYYEKLMADPERKAKFRAHHNAWRKENRKKYGSYPTEEALKKQADYQRKRYQEKQKNDPAFKAAKNKARRKHQATPHAKEYARNWHSQRRATDPNYKLYGALCGRVSALLGRRNNRKGTIELLGCSVPELRAHLEQQWEPGMSWENYGKGIGKWNVDHIRPCASFDLLDPEQAKQCFHFSNLRPLWQQENSSKKSWYNGKHWFREQHPRYSAEICAGPQQLPSCPPAP